MSAVEPFEAGYLHRPDAVSGDALALTHGAGSNCDAKFLVALADALAASGITVYRYNLPFRLKRPSGSPYPSIALEDQAGVREAVGHLRSMVKGRVLAGGMSYGGRQTTMAAAATPDCADGLLLLSYPLHAPGKPQLRTAHFPDLRTKALFIHGQKDPFGTIDEIRQALTLIPAPTELYPVAGAGHDLGRKHAQLAAEIVTRVSNFLLV